MKKIYFIIFAISLLINNIADAYIFTPVINNSTINIKNLSSSDLKISKLNISHGKLKKSIELKWKQNKIKVKYIIYRSNFKNKNYSKITTTYKNKFIDKDVSPGIKYWYKISLKHNDIQVKPAIGYGYSKPNSPKGLNPKNILNIRNKKLPKITDPVEKRKVDLHLNIMDNYYENFITISLVMFIGKIYVRRGTLIVFRDFKVYDIDYSKNIIIVKKEGSQPIKFYCKRLFRFLKKCRSFNVSEKEILPRLIKNALFFCVKRSYKEKKLDNGLIEFYPHYEALGMSTEYFRDYKRWRSNTILFGSNTKDLSKLIDKNRP